MKKSSFATLTILSILLVIVASGCLFMESKIIRNHEAAEIRLEKLDLLIDKIQTDEVAITKEQLTSYFHAEKNVQNTKNIFIKKLGDAWGTLGVFIGFVGVFQIGILVSYYVKSNSRPNNTN